MTNIRFANENDLLKIQEIGSKSLPIYFKANELYSLINNNKFIINVIEEGNEILGFIVVQKKPLKNILHVMSIAVNKNIRNKGYGTLLINSLNSYTGTGYKYITLYVNKSNTNGIIFYIKNNFMYVKTRNNYYSLSHIGKSNDAFKLIKFL